MRRRNEIDDNEEDGDAAFSDEERGHSTGHYREHSEHSGRSINRNYLSKVIISLFSKHYNVINYVIVTDLTSFSDLTIDKSVVYYRV